MAGVCENSSQTSFIPEWGLMNAKNHGGDDDPYFIQQMYDLIRDPANNVYEAAYWMPGRPKSSHPAAM